MALSAWAWERLGLFRPFLDVVLPDGSVSRQPNALTTVDHPWHGARFAVLLDALRDGHPLRWVESHQGGFPAEFYPFGAGLIDLVVWVTTLGTLPAPLVHTYGVGVTFLLPLAGFTVLAARCGVSPWVGVLAAAVHLCVRGWWWSGGSMELVEWGLVTNVAAATFLFLALGPLIRLSDAWSGPAAGAASTLLALAVLTNPRSAIAAAAVAAAVGVTAVMHRDVGAVARRLATPAALAFGLAAPVLIPLLRYRDLYYFVRYSGYASVEEWYRSSVQAVSGPVAVATVVGLLLALRPGAPRAAQVVALTLVAYALLTVSMVRAAWPASVIDQLETTRLMPFQRLLMIAVAAIGIGLVLQMIPWPSMTNDGVLAVLSAAVAALYVVAPASFVPEGDRGLVRIATYAEPSIVELERAVRAVDRAAPPATAVLVLGSSVSWHAQMWAPAWSDRRFFYDDWLWYWQTEHVGAYDPATEHAYRSDATALDQDYLSAHGIGAVVVGGEAKSVAATIPWLSPLSRGASYDAYAVVDPTPLATIDGRPVHLSVDTAAELVIDPGGTAGTLVVRTNWFPRWEATIDGVTVDVIHRPDGYMEVDVPPGTSSVRLRYAVTGLDWLARGMAAVAGLGAVGVTLAGRVRRRGRDG